DRDARQAHMLLPLKQIWNLEALRNRIAEDCHFMLADASLGRQNQLLGSMARRTLRNSELLPPATWLNTELSPPQIWLGLLIMCVEPPRNWRGLLITELGPPVTSPTARMAFTISLLGPGPFVRSLNAFVRVRTIVLFGPKQLVPIPPLKHLVSSLVVSWV